MELLKTLSGIEWLAVIGAITAVSKLIEALIKIDGPATILIRWLLKPFVRFFGSIKAITATVEEIKASVESIQHEVETNSGSSLKDVVQRNEAVSNDLLGMVKDQSTSIHVLTQKSENDDKFSPNLKFTITPAGISKSNHASKALFGYPDGDGGASLAWQNSIPYKQRKTILEQWIYAWENKSIFEADYYILHADRDRAFYVHVEALPICDLDGRLLMHDGSMVVIEKDISIDDLKRRLREDIQV